MTRPQAAAIAALLTGILALGRDARCEPPLGCPEGLADPGHETLFLPIGCPVPYAGRLYTLSAHDRARADMAAASALIDQRTEQRDAARTERDLLFNVNMRLVDASTATTAKLRALAEKVENIPNPPNPPALWPWAAAGSGAVGGPLLVCELADCGSTVTGASVAVGVAVVGLVAWLMGD